MPTEPEDDPVLDHDNASRASLAESGTGILDDETPPGRSDTGSTHAEANPTGTIGVSDYSVADDPTAVDDVAPASRSPTPRSPESRLRAAGLRVTRPRTAIIRVLDDAGCRHEHLTAAQVADRARASLDRTLSVQAVYDCLAALTTTGVVRRIEPAGHPMRYETRVGDNHHHLVCRVCGRTTDVDCTAGSAPCLSPSRHSGFVVDEAEITFWGACPDCTAPAGGRPDPSAHSTKKGQR